MLDAAGKRSLTTLEQALVALPAYRSQVENELAALLLPPPPPGEKVFEWRPASVLVGRRCATEGEVDSAFEAMAKELKARVREGFTVVVGSMVVSASTVVASASVAGFAALVASVPA